MNKASLILIGAGGHARSCIDTIEQEGIYKIAGLIGLPQEVGSKLLGYEVIATDDDISELGKQYQFAIIAVGQIDSPEHRIRLFMHAQEAGFTFPTVISPTAYSSPHSIVGVGTIVMHGAIISAGVHVGSNCIINANSLIEHDSNVEDHCHISTGAILNGNTSIGMGSFIGSGTVVKEGILVGANALVGMGLIVRDNIASNEKYLGRVNI